MSTTAVAASEPLSPLPRRLSPSRANEYASCPKKFYFKNIEKRTEPPSVASTAGNLAHLVFERIFDLPREERTLEQALSMVEPCWTELITPLEGTALHLVAAAKGYAALAPAASTELSEIFVIVRESIEGWFKMERPWNFDPMARELELEAEFEGFRFGGIIDRLDRYTGRLEGDSEPREIWAITDYKSGSVPNDQYVDKAFASGLNTYAWLASAAEGDLRAAGLPAGITVDLLRLVYVRTGDRDGGIKTKRITPTVAENAAKRMAALRQGIEDSYEKGEWDHKVGPLCSYCPFTKLCPEGAAEVERRAALKAERAAEDTARLAAQDAV